MRKLFCFVVAFSFVLSGGNAYSLDGVSKFLPGNTVIMPFDLNEGSDNQTAFQHILNF